MKMKMVEKEYKCKSVHNISIKFITHQYEEFKKI